MNLPAQRAGRFTHASYFLLVPARKAKPADWFRSDSGQPVRRPTYKRLHPQNHALIQEVALDPELLGHVFENLLAAYNPETGMVARKAAGSFYTPRIVVDWMVDQALMVYLKEALSVAALDGRGSRSVAAATEEENIDRLKRLLSWEDESHDFKPAEVEQLIDAVDGLRPFGGRQ